MKCKKCGLDEHVIKKGKRHNQQSYLCKKCNHIFINSNRKQGRPKIYPVSSLKKEIKKLWYPCKKKLRNEIVMSFRWRMLKEKIKKGKKLNKFEKEFKKNGIKYNPKYFEIRTSLIASEVRKNLKKRIPKQKVPSIPYIEKLRN